MILFGAGSKCEDRSLAGEERGRDDALLPAQGQSDGQQGVCDQFREQAAAGSRWQC
jgi:hypothetical protein